MKKRIAVFCSGSGSNFRAIFYSIAVRKLPAEIVLCVSNKPESKAVTFAKQNKIKCFLIREKVFSNKEKYNQTLLESLKQENIDIILLAGYLKKIPLSVVEFYRGRMLNIHPSLLPKFGGAGMYGLKVHESVLESKEIKTGATVHFVGEEFDTGKILLQHSLLVNQSDSPKILAEKVLYLEHQLYPAALELLLSKES